MTLYRTECPYCGNKFNIKTAKTRYNKKLICYACDSVGLYYTIPHEGKIIIKGRKL